MTMLSELEALGSLSMLDVELAATLTRLAGEERPEVTLAVALASAEVQRGNTCLDLSKPLELPPHVDSVVEATELRRALETSPLVQHAEDALTPTRPLVLDARGRLYLARYFDHEQAVARAVRRMAERVMPVRALATTHVDALFGTPTHIPDLQREAALAARSRRLSVIVGGPGTGKTSTVVKLLALLIMDRLAEGQPPPRILLVAPTGKAAQRLNESIESAREKLAVQDAVRAAIQASGQTVHRALGPIPDSLTRFRHGPDLPLDCDVLLLDEASMVDLALMRRLLDAVPEHARVIMLGDPDQLASVEAGGVLADLCRAAETPTSPLAPCVSRLVESHRYPAGSGIARLAEAVHASDARGALTLLRSNAHDDVSLAPEIGAGPLPRELIQQAKRGYARLARVSSLESLALLDGFRVLCAHRRGPDGVEALNLALSRVIRGRATSSHESYRGRPILITQNDYATDLFNGDIGVIQAEARQGTLSACFRKGTDVRRVALGRLPAHESVYAMSVHKSQGSEMEEVAIVLPREPSPVVTRELLFTAITRAKRRVTIYASEAVLRHAIEHRTERASGLCDALTS